MSATVSERASVAKYNAEESVTEMMIKRVRSFFAQMFFKTNLIMIPNLHHPILSLIPIGRKDGGNYPVITAEFIIH